MLCSGDKSSISLLLSLGGGEKGSSHWFGDSAWSRCLSNRCFPERNEKKALVKLLKRKFFQKIISSCATSYLLGAARYSMSCKVCLKMSCWGCPSQDGKIEFGHLHSWIKVKREARHPRQNLFVPNLRERVSKKPGAGKSLLDEPLACVESGGASV